MAMRRFWLWLAPWLLLLSPVIEAQQPSSGAPKSAPSQKGTDWPSFLGPTGDSRSSEKGILTNWSAEGPPLVWQLALGTGYCMPTIAVGRLYQFDRAGDQARLRCLTSTTG